MVKSYKVTEVIPGVRMLDVPTNPREWDFKTFESVVKSLGCDTDGDILHFKVIRDDYGFSFCRIYQMPFISIDYPKFGIHRIIFNLMSGTFKIDEDPQIFHIEGYDAEKV